jgi:N6-L-threonylcarbamoyladenine synthase
VIGVASAKALAYAARKPLYAVNHLHGHIFAPWLHTGGAPPIPQERDVEPEYPFLALLVSGGHSQLVHVDSPVAMTVVARTRDDAAGEAFDKTARLLGLPFPGGPAIDRLAREGDPRAIDFPRHRAERGDLDMSFSGVKTAVKYFLESEPGRKAAAADVAASFQAAVVDVLIDRLERAAARAPYRAAVLSGGVAANSALRAAFEAWSARTGIPGLIPALRFCTDNAAMIAAAADRQGPAVLADPLTLAADPNLPFVLPASTVLR